MPNNTTLDNPRNIPSICERIITIIDLVCEGNRAEFARRVGYTPQTVNGWITRDVGPLVVNKICNTMPFINRNWLLTGDGNMYMDRYKPKKTQENPTITQENPNNPVGSENMIPLSVVRRLLDDMEELRKQNTMLLDMLKTKM